MKRLIAVISLGLGVLSGSYAAIDPRDFPDDSQRERYHELAVGLRCPKCQNQSIAESDSPIANDLRGEIHRMLREGRSDEQIIDFMVARYGDFVLYDPPLSRRTALLWLGPAALLLAGGAIVAVIVANRCRSRPATASPLTDGEQRRLVGLLGDADPSIGQDL
ncbi:cytochrome c-type biogenesis protein CcmH [Paraburkholderia sp. CNPSo 3157]|uniref:Cytochrome c-type biogenesis protein n=1 Tax=Paraburkholderia franconis TaxID=2654983 RepID=A0A7X1TLE3_9BURK|nr:cytochrome c-type biogenesis protein [Paraburkholderia franconis]MPW23369.1 cytochrome c-type biogenesis protein CcmH [Paraburkholderia franconis]